MKKRPEAVCTTGLIVINVAVFLILSLFGQTEDAYFMLRHGAMYEPLVIEMHQYYSRKYTPRVKYTKACNSCSLKEICLPRLERTLPVKKYLSQMLEEDEV